MFGLRSLIELLKNIIKFIVILIAGLVIIYSQLPKLLSMGYGDVGDSLYIALRILAWGYFGLSATVIIIAVFDVPLQIWEHNQGLKMSKQEIQDEYTESEGRPEVKSHIRHMQQDMSKNHMLYSIQKVDVIITDKMHFAVALSYDENGISAPIIVAKGQELIAFNIRTIALKHEVPIIDSPALARAIFYSTNVNQEIPPGLFPAVAEIIARLYQSKSTQISDKSILKLSDDLSIPDDLKHD